MTTTETETKTTPALAEPATDAIFSGPRHAELVAFHEARGWLNCSHKSLLRLETEHAAVVAEEEETDRLFNCSPSFYSAVRGPIDAL